MKTRKVTVVFTVNVMDDVPLDRTKRAIESILQEELHFAHNVKITLTDEPAPTPIPSKN